MTESLDSELVTVYSSQGPLAAAVAKSKLEANGIMAILRYESVGRVFALTVNGVGLVEVLVNGADAESAREILAETSESEPVDTDSGEGN